MNIRNNNSLRPGIESNTIPAGCTMRDALKCLNSLSGSAMTLFVIDSHGKVVGSLTDGDVRRWLVAGGSPDDRVEKAMFRNFMALRPDDNQWETVSKARSRRLRLLPQLDAEGRITGILDLKMIRAKLPLDAVLMAGGKGERLRPLTLETPKPLLKIGGKAIIDYNVDALHGVGVDNIFVTVNYFKEQIISHFAGSEPEVKCVAEPCRLGTIGSLSLVKGLRNDNLLLMNSDILTSLDFEKLWITHISSGADLTIAAVPYPVTIPFAILETDGNRVSGLTEKPTFNYFASGGVYILKRKLVERIPAGEYLDAPDFIESLLRDGGKVVYHPVDGTWIDIGSPADFKYADALMNSNSLLGKP